MALESVLKSAHFHPVLSKKWQNAKTVWLDLSPNNPEAHTFSDPHKLKEYVESSLTNAEAELAIGRYNEVRQIYTSAQFHDEENARTIHLGMDLNLPAGTPIFSPLEAVVHSFADNNAPGDYGPTLILQHSINGHVFYTLYGHLSRSAIGNKTVGQAILAGSPIGSIGEYHENGEWWPHLHFQIIQDLQGKFGDYPGVAAHKDAAFYLSNCPDPNLILNLV